jgi:transcriptional regulator with XRE-family HTH domain
MLKLFGANVKRIRRLKRISQETLAESCGLYRSYLCRIERGTANPTLESIVVLAKALEVDPPHLLLSNPPIESLQLPDAPTTAKRNRRTRQTEPELHPSAAA